MNTEFVNESVNGIRRVGAINGQSEYILWQQDASGAIHFECGTQQNSGYGIVSEVTVDRDGCHLVVDSQIVSFYWHPPRASGLAIFIQGLQELYEETPEVVEMLL
ncbi:MAG: hypothetical protein ACFB0C_22190 [Leptolyngbyaceae cyanobacterium]